MAKEIEEYQQTFEDFGVDYLEGQNNLDIIDTDTAMRFLRAKQMQIISLYTSEHGVFYMTNVTVYFKNIAQIYLKKKQLQHAS